jgi:hypothetical protein
MTSESAKGEIKKKKQVLVKQFFISFSTKKNREGGMEAFVDVLNTRPSVKTRTGFALTL